MNDDVKARYAADSGTRDLLILVDGSDTILGYEEKTQCHRGQGKLHRAFSIFIFNTGGQVLMQQRSAVKPLWPLYWSNSVCSHPRKGEEYLEAAQRRLEEEIGIQTPLRFLFKFQYQAPFKNVGAENELCAVFIGQSDDPVTVDPREIAQCKYIHPGELDRDLRDHPHIYTPWFKKEWEKIRGPHQKNFKHIAFF
ncbi:MAG: isopentenyl-diphosphate Delta-isomerase [bacterium]|nr:isopentenyl-diphosphate Delta-isomerase [bacterium]